MQTGEGQLIWFLFGFGTLQTVTKTQLNESNHDFLLSMRQKGTLVANNLWSYKRGKYNDIRDE